MARQIELQKCMYWVSTTIIHDIPNWNQYCSNSMTTWHQCCYVIMSRDVTKNQSYTLILLLIVWTSFFTYRWTQLIILDYPLPTLQFCSWMMVFYIECCKLDHKIHSHLAQYFKFNHSFCITLALATCHWNGIFNILYCIIGFNKI